MKKITLLLVLGLIAPILHAQKVIEKNIPYNDRTIELEVKFASEIEVKTWDKSTVYFKADIQTDEGKYLDLYQLDIKESSQYISIVSEAEPVFKAFHKERQQSGKKYYYTDDMYDFNYVLYVPKNANFKVSSINGDLSSEIIEGNFTADLINGDIEIKKYSGNLELKTINGAIDLVVKNSALIAETIHGEIYADAKLDLNVTNRHVGQKVMGRFDQAVNTLSLNTINGNMYLRQ
ncbi:hypothetical protein [Flagellimonas allohymeniacidonis]|uniref:Adhesin domain-containing protein n=1 Tax=Flagellimonas allohymeniacidonis TaxID=2517819 RepID=A0A4Q8QAR8_9FLAO|nr:hypothetical protein [Allomuricauda hymeniacidonis]TAI47351.1 hypothetical protein EW142_11780 [Allomuricauda hymeniacidonis]